MALLLTRTWSPPSSPDLDDIAVIATDNRGMVTDTTQTPSPLKEDQVKSAKQKRRTLHYVSRHFTQPQEVVKDEQGRRKGKRRKVDSGNVKWQNVPEDEKARKLALQTNGQPVREEAQVPQGVLHDTGHKRKTRATRSKKDLDPVIATEKKQGTARTPPLAPWQQVLAAPAEQQQATFSRIFFGLNVDELSSDSDLTDVPDEVGPDPFLRRTTRVPRNKKESPSKKIKSEDAELVAVKKKTPKIRPKPKKELTKSPYFPHPHKQRPTFLSTLPFPPLQLERFGLMQERLCHNPFRLLLATIFLNKTPGSRAMPIFFKLMEKYPSPEALADAEQSDVTSIIHELGFQNQRARKCIAMAKRWLVDPPVKSRRWRKPDYPKKGDGKDIKADEVVDEGDQRVAWEISHLPGLGPYSHDSWRMFCRDELRGLASAYNGEDAAEEGDATFEPEWKRVLPADKELRAWMTWMWMKEGWVWNKENGERTRASDELMLIARGEGNVVLENDSNTLIVKSLDEDQPSSLKLSSPEKRDVRVEAPAGDFMPGSSKKDPG